MIYIQKECNPAMQTAADGITTVKLCIEPIKPFNYKRCSKGTTINNCLTFWRPGAVTCRYGWIHKYFRVGKI